MRALRAGLPFVACFGLLIGCVDQPVAPSVDVEESTAIVNYAPDWGPPLQAAARTGVVHNDGLRFVLERLRKERLSKGRLTPPMIAAVVKSACQDFLRAERLSLDPCAELDRMFTEWLATGRVPRFETPSAFGTAWPGLAVEVLAEDDPIAPLAFDLLDQIEVQWSLTGTAASYASALDIIEQQAVAGLSGDDLVLVLSVASVARETAEYWEVEFPVWVDEFLETCIDCGDPLPDASVLADWVCLGQAAGSTVMADVGGAIGGGVWARITKAVIPQAAAGWALGASAGTALALIHSCLV